MDIMDIALVVIMISYQLGIRTLFLNLVSRLGRLAWKLFIFLAFSFARVISAFIFVPLFAIVWTFERFFGYRSPYPEPSSSAQSTNNSKSIPPASRAGRDGIPRDWVTIRLCPTDEISNFELEDRTMVVTQTLDGLFEGGIGSWEQRELFVTTREEIDVKVTSWLDSLAEENRTITLET